MSSWNRLGLLRKLCISASAVLALAVLVADATVLSFLSTKGLHIGSIQGVAGWTMFAAVFSLLLLPLLLTNSMKVQRWVNRTGIELGILALLTLFYFISGIILASKSSNKKCIADTLCMRIRVCTAFAWLTFFALLAAMTTVGLVAHVQARLGLPLFTAYSFDVEGEELNGPPPAHDMHAAATSIGGAYFSGSIPQQQQQTYAPQIQVPEKSF
ncbi:hypothetical protein IW140_002895 [Coemansia sp. RSA 1813]|nr:hypothetical protein EV178_002815 [Coemansia sp. RSA 1646]KAJ1772000.1 hypothetical protein LPJ74_001892 [Coemansia sp. RSA 1843]KAJ2089772.1 hypothetical protein IW138_003228 [Coemansia sp. RSA 986]KAJ2210513.1 hypothetical protein EV179_006192 [Coemansia sp. RSA 487]KAJ2569641.1 hypothetical protein IW140_002895 [Coemansia sp. RSA 1813]